MIDLAQSKWPYFNSAYVIGGYILNLPAVLDKPYVGKWGDFERAKLTLKMLQASRTFDRFAAAKAVMMQSIFSKFMIVL